MIPIIYIEHSGSFTAADVGVLDAWTPYDVGGNHGIPASAIVEISCINSTSNVSYNIGLRSTSSSGEVDGFRRLFLDSAVINDTNTVIHTQLDSSGFLDCWVGHLGAGRLSFSILGYWNGGVYTDAFDVFNPVAPSGWEGYALDAHGVSAGQIAEIVMSNDNATVSRMAGIRTSGSSVNRRFSLKDQKNNGEEQFSLLVYPSGSNAAIEIWSDNIDDVDFRLMGYFSTPPADYTEDNILFPDPTSSNTWVDFNVGASGVPASVLGHFLIQVEVLAWETDVGLRETGSTIDGRILKLDKKNSGENGPTSCTMHSHIDSNSKLEFYTSRTENAATYSLVGYWDNFQNSSGVIPETKSADMFSEGHEFFAGDDNRLYWTDRDTQNIRSSRLDGSDVQVLVAGLGEPRGMRIDTLNNKMYWLDDVALKIQRSNIDGSNIEDLVTTGLGIPTDIDLDIPNGKMYWTDRGTLKIQRANLDGSNVEDLITTGFEQNHGMALDLINNKMYWTDNGFTTKNIQRSNLDGSSIETLVSGLSAPESLVLDIAENKMYWTDFGTNKIQRANLDGTNVEDLVTTGLTTPHGITLDLIRRKMYWVDNGTDKIQKANLDGSNIEDILTVGLVFPDDIRIGPGDSTQMHMFISSPNPSSASGDLFIIGGGTVSSQASGDMFIEGHTVIPQEVDNISLYMRGPDESLPSGPIGRPLDWLIAAPDHFPQIIGTFSTPASSVNIQVWDITDGLNNLVAVTNSGCYAIGDTGRWGWSTSYIPASQGFAKHYFYMMTSDIPETFDGQFIMDIPEGAKWIHPNNQDDYIRRI